MRRSRVDGTGDFTLHGVTKKVTIPLEGRWDGKDVQVVGTLPIVFGDYSITAPTAPVVASVDDHGEMEFQLFFDASALMRGCQTAAYSGLGKRVSH